MRPSVPYLESAARTRYPPKPKKYLLYESSYAERGSSAEPQT